MNYEGLCYSLADRLPRVEAGVGVLVDHLHPPPEWAELLPTHVGYINAVEDYLSVVRLEEAEDKPPRSSLSTPALPD
ncbi:hypothetical protein D1872_346460 [compost metagenome]